MGGNYTLEKSLQIPSLSGQTIQTNEFELSTTLLNAPDDRSDGFHALFGRWLYACTAKEFCMLASNGQDIANVLIDSYVAKFDKHPEINEINSWKNSLPAMAKVISDANLDQQLIVLEYCPPSPDELHYRIDVTVCGLDENYVLNFVFIELKQWTNILPGKEPGFVLVKIGKEWAPRKHPSKQVEEYRHYMEHVFEACRISKYMAKFSVIAYLHNLANPEGEEKDALYGKIAPIEDCKLYTSDFEKALVKRIREKVGFGNGDRAAKFLDEIRTKSKEHFKYLPTSKVPMPERFQAWKNQFKHDQIFVGFLVTIAFGILFGGSIYLYFQTHK